jgi:hypothetical protein
VAVCLRRSPNGFHPSDQGDEVGAVDGPHLVVKPPIDELDDHDPLGEAPDPINPIDGSDHLDGLEG